MLSLGSKRAVERFNALGAKKFSRLSRRILDAMPISKEIPFSEAEQNALLVSLHIEDISEFTYLVG
ncbi:unnamed protein product [Gongylonema pulchrum]|uniref:SEC63 domain-containing protein n=1 Tax=Gongylonema pulchrum TaxID=637853 RepID=A0A183EM05_9BILA|nr:unnamed protein product [Gongylonema pulchrum]